MKGPLTKLTETSRAYAKSFPEPGATVFEPGMTRETASQIAHEHYGSGVDRIDAGENGTWAVRVMGAWKAICGRVGGLDAILHKMEGKRELNTYEPTSETPGIVTDDSTVSLNGEQMSFGAFCTLSQNDGYNRELIRQELQHTGKARLHGGETLELIAAVPTVPRPLTARPSAVLLYDAAVARLLGMLRHWRNEGGEVIHFGSLEPNADISDTTDLEDLLIMAEETRKDALREQAPQIAALDAIRAAVKLPEVRANENSEPDAMADQLADFEQRMRTIREALAKLG